MSKIITQIPQTVLMDYETKFKMLEEQSADMKWRLATIDPTAFAYLFFKDRKGKPLKLYPFQDMIINSKAKRIAVAVSRQTGKSTASIIYAFWYIYFHHNSTVLLISKTKTQSMELISKMKQLLAGTDITFSEVLTGPDNRYELYVKNEGSQTHSRMISVPATDAARGYSADLVIADEIAFWDKATETFNEAIVPTISHTDGKILMLSTPKGTMGVFYEAFTKHDLWECYQFDWRVCPVHTLEKMEEKRKDIGDFAFRQEYEASFMANNAAYFKEKEVRDATKDLDLGQPTALPVVIGVDFGKINDASIITIGCIENPMDEPDYQRIRIVDIIEKPLGTDYNKIVGELKALFGKYNIHNIVYDATGVGEGPGDFMKDLGLPVEPVKFSIQSKVNIYSNLKLLFEKRQIFIPRSCKKLIDELLTFEYEYTTSGNMKLHHADGGHDDFADSIALCTFGLKRPTYASASFSSCIPDKKVVDNEDARPFHYENKLIIMPNGSIRQDMIKVYEEVIKNDKTRNTE